MVFEIWTGVGWGQVGMHSVSVVVVVVTCPPPLQ